MAIDRQKNKTQFLEGMKAEYDKLKAMDDSCFAHCGWYTYMNNGEDKKEGQDVLSYWYKGTGGPQLPPPPKGGDD